MGLYKYMQELWKKPKLLANYKSYLIQWRREPTVIRVEKPTRIDRARALGYRAKQGVIVLRVRILRGGRMKDLPAGGRKPRRFTRRLNLDMNYQRIAEHRANKKYPNFEILNSYWVGKDGRFVWHEVIMLDRESPVIKKDSIYSKIIEQKSRTFRGLTSAGRKTRGLSKKGKGAEKVRPSKSAYYRRKSSHPKRK